jgi:predicted ATP-grasp superfamily ATP-dependent carboligase
MQCSDKKILLLDAETRSALACVRSLGKAGYTCYTASIKKHAIASSSKYSKKSLLCPDIKKDLSVFIEWLENTILSSDIHTVLPMTDATIEGISKFEDRIKSITNYPIINSSTLNSVQDKFSLINHARSFEINVPETVSLKLKSKDDLHTLNYILEELTFPFILKPCRSAEFTNKGKIISYPKKIIHNESDYYSFLSLIDIFPAHYLAQELIQGSGMGIFCLYHSGKPVLNFAHKRLLEKPPEGGVSVLSCSIPIPEDLLKKVHKLLDSYSWNGVAMTEFKLTPDGTPFLMEINPRFWGSLQLAIDSDYNFPLSLINENYTNKHSVSKNNLRWEIGTLDHIYISIKQKGFFNFLRRLLKNEFMFFKPNTHNEVLRISDPMPFITEVISYLKRS